MLFVVSLLVRGLARFLVLAGADDGTKVIRAGFCGGSSAWKAGWSHGRPQQSHSSQRRYPPELRERAVRMVLETIEQTGERFGAITRVARQLGIGSESLRSWVRQAEVDGGQRPG